MKKFYRLSIIVWGSILLFFACFFSLLYGCEGIKKHNETCKAITVRQTTRMAYGITYHGISIDAQSITGDMPPRRFEIFDELTYDQMMDVTIYYAAANKTFGCKSQGLGHRELTRIKGMEKHSSNPGKQTMYATLLIILGCFCGVGVLTVIILNRQLAEWVSKGESDWDTVDRDEDPEEKDSELEQESRIREMIREELRSHLGTPAANINIVATPRSNPSVYSYPGMYAQPYPIPTDPKDYMFEMTNIINKQ